MDHSTVGAVNLDGSTVEHLATRVERMVGGRVQDLKLLVSDDGLIVRGFARTYHAKQLAQHVLMNETGLPILNQIDVK